MDSSQGDLRLESPREFAKRIALPFKNYSLLSRALTHRSYLNEHTEALEDNERLEFLGDAVLDFVVGAWLYNRFPELAEGSLTRLRAALVKTEQLAIFGENIEIGLALRLGRGEEEGGGRKRKAMLCASFEALIGALHLDSGIDQVIKFIEPFLENAIDNIIANHKDLDPKSLLQEWAQAQGFAIPIYRVIKEDGPDHAKTFTLEVYVNGEVISQGVGQSKQDASKAAAKAAIIKIDL